MQGVSASITSSASTTANGSGPDQFMGAHARRGPGRAPPSAGYRRRRSCRKPAVRSPAVLSCCAIRAAVSSSKLTSKWSSMADFAAARDDDDVLNAGMQRLFHAVLNDRLVHQRQHFFGMRLGGGQKSGPETGGGKNCFANFRCGHSIPILSVRRRCSQARRVCDCARFAQTKHVWYVGSFRENIWHM